MTDVNKYRIGIRANHIDQIDNINNSGTLEGITFYQGRVSKNPESNIKSALESFIEIMQPPPATSMSGMQRPISKPPINRSSDKKSINRSSDTTPGSGSGLKANAETKKQDIDANKKALEIEKKLAHSILDSDSESESESKLSDSKKPIRMRAEKIIKENDLIESILISQNTTPLITDSLGSDLELNNQTIDQSIILESDNATLMMYSHYFALDDIKKKFIFIFDDLIKELFVILFIHLFLGIHNAIFNVITIDGILTCIIFYMNYSGVEDKNNFLLKNRLSTLDRYIYYLLLFCGYYIFNFMTWDNFKFIAMYVASTMICPSIMGKIYDIYSYKKIRQVLYDGYNRLIQKIICKQLSKIINIIIKNVLNINITIGYEDLYPSYNQFSWLIINKFIITFILACIFNHIDKGGMKFPMMIYKNLYMKDTKYSISDDKNYLKKIIEDKQFDKFMDVYTLNRIIRMIISDDSQNSMLSEQVTAFLQKIAFRINRVMVCWTIMSICTSNLLIMYILNYIHVQNSLILGILSFLLFISSSNSPLKYLINTLFFVLISLITDEKILMIILCELCYPIVDSKLLSDVSDDIYQSLKRGFLNLYHRTRLESVILSISLGYMSYMKYNNIGIITVCILNLIVMIRAYMYKELVSGNIFISIKKPDILSGFVESVKLIASSIVLKKTVITPITTNISISDINPHAIESNSLKNESNVKSIKTIQKKLLDDIHNKDILLIIKDLIIYIFKNNLLINVFNPFNQIPIFEVLRLFAHLFLLLLLGIISKFSLFHIIFLPIIVQNIIDIIM